MRTKRVSIILVLTILSAILVSCAAPVSSSPSSRISSVAAAPDATAPEASAKQLNIAPFQEPPLSDYVRLTLAVPDFLDAELQNLYRRAWMFSSCLFFSSMSIDAGFPLLETQSQRNEYTRYEPADTAFFRGNYYYSKGRYQNWNDFEAVMYSIFTPDCFEALNNPDRLWPPRFFPVDGHLVVSDSDLGTNIMLSGVPDEFELIRKSESEIVLNAIGHYIYDVEGETHEEWQLRRETTYDYTEAFPLRLVKTEAGWRFSEFSVTR